MTRKITAKKRQNIIENQQKELEYFYKYGHSIQKEYIKNKFYKVVYTGLLEYMSNAHKEGYIIKGQYLNNKTPLTLMCKNGHEYECSGDKFKAGRRCCYCKKEGYDNGNIGKKSKKEIIQIHRSILSNYYEKGHVRQSEYINSRNYEVVFRGLIAFLKELDKYSFILNSQYTTMLKNVSITCKFGHTTEKEPKSFIYGFHCSVCSGKNSKDAERKLFEEAAKRGDVFSSQYINNASKMEIIYGCCGFKSKIKPTLYMKSPSGCKKCNKKCPEKAAEELKKLTETRGDILLTSYTNSITKVKIKYHCCGLEHFIMPGSYKKGVECPNCTTNESKIAKFAKLYASEIFKDVIHEYRKCKNINTGRFLPFDIYISDINLLFEIHGEQHWTKNNRFHSNQGDFERQIKRDEYKKRWAILNGYCYLAIDIRKHNINSVKNLLSSLKEFQYQTDNLSISIQS